MKSGTMSGFLLGFMKQQKIQFNTSRRPQVEDKSDQLSFADYWEFQRKPQKIQPKEQNLFGKKRTPPPRAVFDFKIKKRRPLWKDLAIFCLTTLGAWGMTHVGMNISAYSQIVEYKAEQMQASVFSPKKEETPKVEKIEKRRTPFRNKKIQPQNQAQKVFSDLTVHPSDNRIVLPRIGKNVPLVTVPSHKNWNNLENNIQKGLKDGAVVHPISHMPGNAGNLFVTGHSSYYAWDDGRYKDVFALLHELKTGDTVEIYWEGKKYVYELTGSKVIPPTETSVLSQPVDRRIITLMTCTPVGTNKNRLIWTGDLIAVE